MKDAEPLGDNIIHSVTNPIPRLTGAIHVYGGDFFAAERSEWDPETLQEGRLRRRQEHETVRRGQCDLPDGVIRGSDLAMVERVYAIHSDAECERLEAQARLAPLSSHVKYLPLKPRISVLDAGCGSGSMTRQIARAEPDATVMGVDLRDSYLDFARRKAAFRKSSPTLPSKGATFARYRLLTLPLTSSGTSTCCNGLATLWLPCANSRG